MDGRTTSRKGTPGERLWEQFRVRLEAELSGHGAKIEFAEKLGIRRQQIHGYLGTARREPQAPLFIEMLHLLGWADEYGAGKTWEATMRAADKKFQKAPEGLKTDVARSIGMTYLKLHRYLRLQMMPPAWRAIELMAVIRKTFPKK